MENKLSALQAVARTVRALSMDAVQKANSGHPGLPLGSADIGAALFGQVLKINPAHPDWVDRDRFVLSAGHGSMFLYSLLHLSGFGISLDDIKNFRQIGSITPGHPEYGMTPGVETTTGPLGAGISNAVGMAIAETMLAARFNTPAHSVIDHYTYFLAGDGCMMEGISSEAVSLAGHLRLGKLIGIYDSNGISIEGSTGLTFTEDVAARFRGYGWQVLEGDGHDIDAVIALLGKARAEREKPSLLILRTTIAKGAPALAGSEKSHGAPLGKEEIAGARKNLGIPEDAEFYVDPAAAAFFRERRLEWESAYKRWETGFQSWKKENADLAAQWGALFAGPGADNHGVCGSGAAGSDSGPAGGQVDTVKFPAYKPGDSAATRSAGGDALKAAAAAIPALVGGSADLAPSNNTALPYGSYSADNRLGRTLHFGVREHAMGGICNGIALHGGFRPFCATFLVFSDYMRPAVRLAALMKLPVIYVFTHDSIFVGEDGPTHQPIEHLAALRTIPNLAVFRPADAEETAAAWEFALRRTDGPTVLALSRQKLPVSAKADPDWKDNFRHGGYVVSEPDGKPDLVLAATGSEVALALETAKLLADRKVRVVSITERNLLLSQEKGFRERLLPADARRVVIEAGVSMGWEAVASSPADIVCIDRFGESGPGEKVAVHLGLDPAVIAARIGKG